MMKKFFQIFLILLATISLAYADASSDMLSNLLKNMHSMQANFTQTIVDKKGKTLQTSTGTMSLQRPSRFRWDVKQPIAQLIVTNGVRLWVYDPDLEQVAIRRLPSAVGSTPALLLSNEDLSLTTEFNVRSLPNSSSQEWFLLNPKDPSSMIAAIKLGFANGEVQEMHIQDHLGHLTKIRFSHVQMNVPLNPALFIFKPPAHIDIIDETKH